MKTATKELLIMLAIIFFIFICIYIHQVGTKDIMLRIWLGSRGGV